MSGNKRAGRFSFYTVSELLKGLLFPCQQADLLIVLNHNSVYEPNDTKCLLVGSLYLVPPNCGSMLSFDKSHKDVFMSVDVRVVKLFTEDPHDSIFKVGEKQVTVNYL